MHLQRRSEGSAPKVSEHPSHLRIRCYFNTYRNKSSLTVFLYFSYSRYLYKQVWTIYFFLLWRKCVFFLPKKIRSLFAVAKKRSLFIFVYTNFCSLCFICIQENLFAFYCFGRSCSTPHEILIKITLNTLLNLRFYLKKNVLTSLYEDKNFVVRLCFDDIFNLLFMIL